MSCIVDDTTQTYQCRQVDPLCDSNCCIWRAYCVSVFTGQNGHFVCPDAELTFASTQTRTHTHFFVAHILSRKTQLLSEFDPFCPLFVKSRTSSWSFMISKQHLLRSSSGWEPMHQPMKKKKQTAIKYTKMKPSVEFALHMS